MAELAQSALIGAAAGGHAAFIDRFPANIKITRATVHRMLEQAAAYGHVDVVNKMLALDYTDEGLELAAQAAVKYDQSQVIDALITVKATAHVARAAAEYGNLPALEKAHAAANSSPSNSDLVFEEYAVLAASNGHSNVISWVFCTVDKIKVNVDYTPAIILAIEAGHVDIAHALITRVKRPNLKTRLMLYAEALGSSSIGNSVLTSLAAANVLPPRSLRACLDAIKMNPSNVFPAALCNHGEFSDEFKDDLLEATVLLMAKLKHYTQIKLLIRAEPGVEYMVPGVVGMIGVLHGDGELISVLTGGIDGRAITPDEAFHAATSVGMMHLLRYRDMRYGQSFLAFAAVPDADLERMEKDFAEMCAGINCSASGPQSSFDVLKDQSIANPVKMQRDYDAAIQSAQVAGHHDMVERLVKRRGLILAQE
jgi:hypothetical protein